MSGGALAGAIVGSVFGAAIVAVVVLFLVKRQRHAKLASASTSSESYNDTVLIDLKGRQGPGRGSESQVLGNSSSQILNAARRLGQSIRSLGRQDSKASWEIPESAVEICLNEDGSAVELGRGGFGVVYKGILNGVQQVAVKIMRNPGMDGKDAINREIAILEHVSRDRNVVQFYGELVCCVHTRGLLLGVYRGIKGFPMYVRPWFLTVSCPPSLAHAGTCLASDDLMIVTELMEGGDLRAALDSIDSPMLHWSSLGRQIALDIVRGLCFLHANNVIHRDLKSKNVLLTADWATAKIADVGAAAIHSKGYLTASAGQVLGTLAWAAPELLLGQKITPKADIFSCGVVLWEIVTGKAPLRGYVSRPQGVSQCPEKVADIIVQCLEPDPEHRPTARQLYDQLAAIPAVEAA